MLALVRHTRSTGLHPKRQSRVLHHRTAQPAKALPSSYYVWSSGLQCGAPEPARVTQLASARVLPALWLMIPWAQPRPLHHLLKHSQSCSGTAEADSYWKWTLLGRVYTLVGLKPSSLNVKTNRRVSSSRTWGGRGPRVSVTGTTSQWGGLLNNASSRQKKGITGPSRENSTFFPCFSNWSLCSLWVCGARQRVDAWVFWCVTFTQRPGGTSVSRVVMQWFNISLF